MGSDTCLNQLRFDQLKQREEEELWEVGPQQSGRRRLVPESSEGLIRFGSVPSKRSGQTVWLPAMPKPDATAHERMVKRRIWRKEWKRARQAERRLKSDSGVVQQ